MRLKNILISKKNNMNIAFIYGTEEITYKELYNNVEKSASIIRYYSNIGKSIGIFISNSINYATAYFTISFLDKVIVPINTKIKKNELICTIEYCELQLIVSDNNNLSKLKQYLYNFNYNIKIYNIDTDVFECIGNGNELPIDTNSKELDNVALMLHTSGTLSLPKRVMLTHINLMSCIESIIKSLKITKEDRTLIALPMFLASANTAQLLTHMYLGASVVIMDSLFTSGYFLKMIEKHKITNFTAVPYMMLNLLENKNKHRYDISLLKFICFGGASTPTEKISELINTFKEVKLIQLYGQTEASPRISHMFYRDSQEKIASIGKPLPGLKWKLVDDKDEEVVVGQAGEIIVKGKSIMKGYYKRKELTQETIKDGWLYTGDIGKLDKEGFMYIVGRKKNIIIRGGMNIYPEEIEEVLLLHDAVKEVCVTSKEDEFLGEVPVANIVLNSVIHNITEELNEFCFENLASYKLPDEFRFVLQLPKTDSGKIIRKKKVTSEWGKVLKKS